MKAVTLALLLLLVFTVNIFANDEVLVSGVWTKGQTIVDPRPVKSKYFKVFQGGFRVSSQGARYWLLADIIVEVPSDLWVTVECEDPLNPKKPFMEEGPVKAGSKNIHYGSDYIKGLKMFRVYRMKMTLYSPKDKTKILDELTQNIKAYVDTTGEKVLMSNDLSKKH